ncbi:alpha/beta hydrolase [Haploplasma modicum]|uniref:alpha/beta hydrolase n=1 Tax=Haploplasma modicum TaxID=2150 RepID=UPI00214C25C4|nr:alpha/beta hydrolase [Haploplasma modicum]MCR1808779.1 alpha/beta hydrolase [Haploplasma modicum]
MILRRVLKIGSIILLSIVSLLVVISLYFYLSVKPTVWLVRWAFNQSSYTSHESISNIKEEVLIYEDLVYPSKYKKNKFDIFVAEENKDKTNLKTILWIHGGAFVAGDKKDVKDYMYVLASEGYVVISMNYGLGFENKYPTPLLQITELYNHLLNSSETYKFIDLSNLILGGDSAGAFIAAQFAIIQTNQLYSDLVGIKASINHNDIKGMILFCGPYDFNMLKNLLSNTAITNSSNIIIRKGVPLIINKIGEAFLNDKNWSTSDKWQELSLINYINEDFPKTFLTDGNTLSFEDHARELEAKLIEKDVLVKSVYYDTKLTHEYQFNLSTINNDGRNYGMETLNELLLYLQSL